MVATPIGNLEEVSPRVRRVLAEADLIAAEDTRVTRKLLGALGIPCPELVSYRGHDEVARAERLLERVADQNVVLVSDAGTPAVSDPGQQLVRLCLKRGLAVQVVSGPSAVAAAISGSGLAPVPFQFLGFPPRKAGPLRQWLKRFGGFPGSLVLFEAPVRTVATVRALAEVFPDREVTLCRELTKLHEELLLLPVAELLADLASRERIRGEVVLVVGPGEAPPEEGQEAARLDNLKQIAAALAERWGCSKREAYQRLLALE